jgi:hypothetical protein
VRSTDYFLIWQLKYFCLLLCIFSLVCGHFRKFVIMMVEIRIVEISTLKLTAGFTGSFDIEKIVVDTCKI